MGSKSAVGPRAPKSSKRAGGAGARRSAPARGRRPRGVKLRIWLAWLVGGPLVLGVLALSLLFTWASRPGPGSGKLVAVDIPPGSPLEVGRLLQERGLVDSPWLFAAYFGILESRLRLETGEHLLLDSLAPRDLVAQLARLRNRSSVRVTLLEGWTHFEIGKQLEAHGVCSSAAFERAVTDEALLRRVGIDADSAEGYLFPDTYELLLDSSAESVVVNLVQQARKEHARLSRAHPRSATRLRELMGFGEQEWVTLASILEKEAGNPRELPVIASVFFNRLTDPAFRPERMLQSDPTAGYGCLVEPERAASCRGFSGKITPQMLRDSDNRYNTYRHAGLPPGPVSNPGRRALLAVLEPAETDYLFFFADGNGNHTFTRTFDEHRAAIRQRQGR